MPGAYEVSREFKRKLRRKPQRMQEAVAECIRRVLTDPDNPGLRIHPMQGYRGIFEAYIDQGNRITFERHDGKYFFRTNCNHDVLRNP